ncbi:polysaccharide biosynthesis protein [Ahrensia kielensis]|uniref:polysaccharide biosynthesis protein n=1 Tax=Ahrensia kielensis TaxID=76980 RepID=UPI003CCC0675
MALSCNGCVIWQRGLKLWRLFGRLLPTVWLPVNAFLLALILPLVIRKVLPSVLAVLQIGKVFGNGFRHLFQTMLTISQTHMKQLESSTKRLLTAWLMVRFGDIHTSMGSVIPVLRQQNQAMLLA